MPQAFTKVLTPNEERVKLMMFTELDNKQIAKALKISVPAVSGAAKHLYDKEGVNGRFGLMAKEIQRCYAELVVVKTQSKT